MWLHAEISTLADIPRHWAAAALTGGWYHTGDLGRRDQTGLLYLVDRLTHCRTLIAGYKVPKQICFTDSLPMTSSGKIRKAMLRQQHRPQSAASLA